MMHLCYFQVLEIIMRQLKGKEKKETRKEKKERREDNKQIHKSLTTVVLPTLLAIVAIIVTFVYISSRPKQINQR